MKISKTLLISIIFLFCFFAYAKNDAERVNGGGINGGGGYFEKVGPGGGGGGSGFTNGGGIGGFR